MKAINLKQFSVDDLLVLRDRVNAMLASRVDRERRELQSRLNRLQRFKAATATPSKAKPSAKAVEKPAKKKRRKPIAKVAPKYRNPDQPSETWAGRGLQPRWLSAALKSGQKIEDFQI
jgi:DNA-binding protein H-NS